MRSSASVIVLIVSSFASLSALAKKRSYDLNAGDRITIPAGDSAVVSCAATADTAPEKSEVRGNDKCHKFHSDSSCQDMVIGTACKKSNTMAGVCVSAGLFAGGPKCECQ